MVADMDWHTAHAILRAWISEQWALGQQPTRAQLFDAMRQYHVPYKLVYLSVSCGELERDFFREGIHYAHTQ